MSLDLEGALQALQANGLAGHIVPAREPRLLGGSAVRDVAGTRAYDDCFSFVPQGLAWLVRAERRGERRVDAFTAESLDAAVRIVLGLKRK